MNIMVEGGLRNVISFSVHIKSEPQRRPVSKSLRVFWGKLFPHTPDMHYKGLGLTHPHTAHVPNQLNYNGLNSFFTYISKVANE